MATMTATAVTITTHRRHTVTVPPRSKRRYSTPSEWISSFTRSTKRRAASSATPQQTQASPIDKRKLAGGKEAEVEEIEEVVDYVAPLEPSPTWQKRLSKRMGLVTQNHDWSLQDAIPSVQDGVTGTWQAIRRISRTEPSHETNFPPSDVFPNEGGLRVTMPIYGMIDAVSEHSMRLLLLQGMRTAPVPDDEKGKQHQRKPFELPASSLRNGDWLCNPPSGPYANDPTMAMVLRGEIQGFDVKCRIVGMFPIQTFGERPPKTYQMDVVIF